MNEWKIAKTQELLDFIQRQRAGMELGLPKRRIVGDIWDRVYLLRRHGVDEFPYPISSGEIDYEELWRLIDGEDESAQSRERKRTPEADDLIRRLRERKKRVRERHRS